MCNVVITGRLHGFRTPVKNQSHTKKVSKYKYCKKTMGPGRYRGEKHSAVCAH